MALPADEDAAARVASTALEARFLARGGVATARTGESSVEEAHESEHEDEELHGAVNVVFVRVVEESMIGRRVREEGRAMDMEICVYIDTGEGSWRNMCGRYQAFLHFKSLKDPAQGRRRATVEVCTTPDEYMAVA